MSDKLLPKVIGIEINIQREMIDRIYSIDAEKRIDVLIIDGDRRVEMTLEEFLDRLFGKGEA